MKNDFMHIMSEDGCHAVEYFADDSQFMTLSYLWNMPPCIIGYKLSHNRISCCLGYQLFLVSVLSGTLPLAHVFWCQTMLSSTCEWLFPLIDEVLPYSRR